MEGAERLAALRACTSPPSRFVYMAASHIKPFIPCLMHNILLQRFFYEFRFISLCFLYTRVQLIFFNLKFLVEFLCIISLIKFSCKKKQVLYFHSSPSEKSLQKRIPLFLRCLYLPLSIMTYCNP